MRHGIDCIGANAAEMHRMFPSPDLVFTYVTGSPEIIWTPQDEQLWPGVPKVSIDQGGPGSPVPWAIVRDVEPGAWSPVRAVTDKNWTAERPTIYCDRNDLQYVIAAGWRGDVWLAWPGYNAPAPPQYQGVNIVAVQNEFGAGYDASYIYDPTWPFGTGKEQDMTTFQVKPGEYNFTPFAQGQFRQLLMLRDFATPITSTQVRLAVRSAAKGWHVEMLTIEGNSPVTVTFPMTDADAVSIKNDDAVFPIGITLL